MFMFHFIRKSLKTAKHHPRLGGLEILKYIGPGLLVTVGFIDPGNWASNLAAGADYGYTLLWMVSLSTVMLIILQHNVAHLGIATGLCLSEATMTYIRPKYAKMMLWTAMGASVSTSLAEILGGAIALEMLFGIPVRIGAILTTVFVCIMLFTNSYRVIERWIIAFVSIIGLSFIYELSLVHIDWGEAALAWVTPSFPKGSMVVIMSVLGAVVMPHNLFLHSEVIQSRQWNLEDDKVIRRQLRYEFWDTFLSMMIGWAINSAMILMAAASFYQNGNGTTVDDLAVTGSMLAPLLGNMASLVFAVALLLSGISSSITAGMAGGTIFSGIFNKPYDTSGKETKLGILVTMVPAAVIILFISSPFQGLIYSQMLLAVQLPITIFTQICLTSSKRVMGRYANSRRLNIVLWITALTVTFLNIGLFITGF